MHKQVVYLGLSRALLVSRKYTNECHLYKLTEHVVNLNVSRALTNRLDVFLGTERFF